MIGLRRFIVASALLACVAQATFNFVSIGDWGCVPIGGYHEQDELIVAKKFSEAATSVDAKFVLNTGDNFYYCGIHSKTDTMWNSTFEGVFTAPSTMVPWYSCLGNHDYGYPGSATAQIEYVSPNNNRWVMPGRYYYKRLVFPNEVNISLLVLDATPCQKDYVNDDPSKWDPCGSVIPGCPGCTFHENVIKQSCSAQLTWMNSIIPSIPADDWKIVMIHAPAGDINEVDLITPLQQAKFDLYINGHVHLLSHYTMDNAGTYITTGAACMVRVPAAQAEKKINIPEAKWTPSSCPSSSSNGHSCQIVWEQTIAGYTTHSFSSDFSELSTFIYDYDGNLLHTAVIQKGGGSGSGSGSLPTSPPTSPPSGSSSAGSATSAPSSSSSSGSCCYYSTSSCHSGMTCCSESGESYKESTCKGADGKRHHCEWTGSSCVVY
jgi:hypothetical protein